MGFLSNAQVSNSLGVWVDHLPYTEAVDIEEHDFTTFVATKQGLYTYYIKERQLDRVSKVNGLNDIGLTDIAWSDEYQILLIGYDNGNLDIYDNGTIRNFPDIRLSSNYSGLKQINHIHIVDNLAYISTDFGIVSFDFLEELVLETYVIGPNGTFLSVNQTASDNDSLYAATPNGLYSTNIDGAKFFFENWRSSNRINHEADKVTVFDDNVFVNLSYPPNGDSILYREDSTWKWFPRNEIADNRDLRVTKGYLSITNSFSARAYGADFSFFKNFNSTTLEDSTFSPVGAVIGANDENYWIADLNQGMFHVYQVYPDIIYPTSPRSKDVYQLNSQNEMLFVGPGSLNDVGAPLFNNTGFYALENLTWTNFGSEVLDDYKDIIDVVVDPLDENHYFVSSYGSGILELMRNGNELEIMRIINEQTTNGALPSVSGSGAHRIADLELDEEGNIWFSNALAENPLGVIRPDGSVESFYLGSLGAGADVRKILPTSLGQVWLQKRNDGIIVAKVDDPNNIEVAKLSTSEGSGNLPSQTVQAFDEDLDGEIWIGTNEGLGVIFNPEDIFEPNRVYDAATIVIDEDGDGNGELVLGSESITDIEIDGSNKKWFGTANSGVFYTSENGREQLNRFFYDNSPLPSDKIIDIEIDDISGMVYFGTDEGIVSFQGEATEGVETMTDVFAYPNPVTPDYQGSILIRGLVTNAQVKITDFEGNIVFETVAEGGQAIWSGRNFSGERVRSGVYLAYITDDLGANTHVTKILIIN